MEKTLKKLLEIKNEMKEVRFDKKDFTRKEFENHFKGQKLVSIKYLEDMKVIRNTRKELVKVKLPTPIVEYKINGVVVDTYYAKLLLNSMNYEERVKANITKQEVNEIEKERFYFQYNENVLIEEIRKLINKEKRNLKQKIEMLKFEIEDLETELKELDYKI